MKATSADIAPRIVLGVELKGWYVLAKEKEPSFRYKVTPAVCAQADLLVVVPWALSNVVSGSPILFTPFVMGAKYAAEYRNWYWEYERSTTASRAITLSTVRQQYPTKSDMISDRPESDGGGNFGRLARTGVMADYIRELFDERLSGIPVAAWQRFLSIFTESCSIEEIERSLDRIAASVASVSDSRRIDAIKEKLLELAAIIESR